MWGAFELCLSPVVVALPPKKALVFWFAYDSVGIFGICRNQKNRRYSSFLQPYRQAGCLASAFPSNRPPSRSADTAPTNACVCGLLPSSSPSLLSSLRITPRTGDTPQAFSPTRPPHSVRGQNLPAVLGGPSASQSPSLLQILNRVQCFSVVLANSRVSIAGSSCATLRLRLRVAFAHPAIWVGRR